MYIFRQFILITCFLILFIVSSNVFSQELFDNEKIMITDDENQFHVLYPKEVPVGLTELYLIVKKGSKGIGGVSVTVHKNDESIQASGSTEYTGHIILPLNHHIQSKGELTFEISYGKTYTFTGNSKVIDKLSGQSWFVDVNNGDDRNTGTNWENAFKRITYALVQANGIPGNPDTINIASGLYDPYMQYGDGEIFPLVMKSYVYVYGMNNKDTILDAKLLDRVVRFQNVVDVIFNGFTITGGELDSCGGGVYFYNSSGTLSNNIIIDNDGSHGGGVCCNISSPIIHNNIIVANKNVVNGAGITIAQSSSPIITNCTIAINDGPGIQVPDLTTSNPQISDCIVWDNNDDLVNIQSTEISYSDISDGDYNGFNNNFSDDPLFLCGYYLSHTASGQSQNSPCNNAGSKSAAAANLDNATTRIDGINDSGLVDVGFHYLTPCTDMCYISILPPTDVYLFLDTNCGSSTYQFVASSNNCSGSIVWTSSDPEVATVDPLTGFVTALTLGNTTITAQCTTDSSCFAEAYVYVNECCYIDIIEPTDITLYTSIACGPNAHDFDATSYLCGGNIIWRSSNRNIADVHPTTGFVTAEGPGTCTITAQCSGDLNCYDEAIVTVIYCSASCMVDIVDPEEVIIYLDPLCGPMTHDFDALVSDCTGAVSWTSSNTDVATIHPIQGFVTPVGIGFTIIKAECTSNPSCFDEGILVVSDCNSGEIDATPTDLYFESGLNDNNTNDPGMTMLNQSSLNSNSINSNYYYYSDNGKFYLELSKKQIVIKFVENADDITKTSILSSYDKIENFDLNEILTGKGFILVDLVSEITEDNVIELVDVLSRNKNIDISSPVFIVGNNRVIPTNEIITKFSSKVPKSLRESILDNLDISVVEELSYEKDAYLLDNHRSNGFVLLEQANLLHEKTETKFAEPNFLMLLERLATPDDTYYLSQWALENNAQLAWGTVDADIDAECAWDIDTGGSTVTVAIIDEGVDLVHEDLVNNIDLWYDATDNPYGTNPNPADGHGTGCAGIAAGQGNNGIGVSGVGWNMKIMPIRIAYGWGSGWATTNAWIADGINWAVDNGADVLSNSWGGGGSSTLINNAIQHAKFDGRDGKGCLVLFSSGNSNSGVIYPSTRPEVISVGASSPCDERKQPSSCDGEGWWGSCYGNELDIMSPGVKIYTTDITGSGGYNNSGNYISDFNGTSSACPGAAGLCALILSYNSNLTSPEVQWILENASDDMVGEPSEESPGWDIYHGHGRINACQSLIRTATGQNLRFVTVSNLGSGPLVVYNVRSRNFYPWLEATPKAFVLNTTESQVVTVIVDDALADFGTNNDILQIFSDDADESRFNIPVTFFNYELNADFSADDTSGGAPHNVQFTDFSTGTIDSWNWDFGDGNTSNLPSPEHTYMNQGAYTVQLEVTGSGRNHTETKIDYIIVDCGIGLNADSITLWDNLFCGFTQFDIDVINETCSGSISFLSMNPGVASVDPNSGLVTAVSPGFCQVIAQCSTDLTCYSAVDVTVIHCDIIPAPTTSPTSTPTTSYTPPPTNTPSNSPSPTPTPSQNMEFLVNENIDNEQTTPAIGSDIYGNFIVTWMSNRQDKSGAGIFARRFTNSGNPIGEEFQVNTFYHNIQVDPDIAVNQEGKFVIVWTGLGQDGSAYGVFAQRYNSDGSPAGEEFQVNTYIKNVQWEPKVAMDKNGNFVITWASKYQDTYGYGIYAKIYDIDGHPLGDEFLVNTYWKGNQITPDVEMDDDGNFVVTWAGYKYLMMYDIYAQRFDRWGNPIGSEFRINTYIEENQNNPAIALDCCGNFVITWESYGQDGSLLGIYARRYNFDGIPLSDEFQVNNYTNGYQALPSIAMDSLGNFLITWRSSGQDGSSYGIFARLYDLNGYSVWDEFQVNSYTRSNQSYGSSTMNGALDFIITWASNAQVNRESGLDIFAKIYKDDSINPMK